MFLCEIATVFAIEWTAMARATIPVKAFSKVACGTCVALLAVVLAGPVLAAGDQVVNCYDAGRDAVTRVLTGTCKGEVVSDARAEEIREHRRNRVLRKLRPKPSTAPSKRKLAGIGTGFFVSDDGKLLTNHHVIDACKALTVETTAGKRLPATLVGSEARYDLALLDVGVPPPGVASFRDFVDVEPGDRADIIGYPTQGVAPIEPFFTEATYFKRCLKPGACAGFQIKGDVRSGNSGGPVLDDGARVIGVVFARLNTVKIYERTGKVVRNVGLAVQNVVARHFLDSHRVTYRKSVARTAMSREEVFTAARPFIARVGCWK